MEIQICRFQETILEIVEIEEHTVHIKLRLRIAVGPIQPTCTTQLDVWQLTDCLLQEFFLLLIVSTASLSSALMASSWQGREVTANISVSSSRMGIR